MHPGCSKKTQRITLEKLTTKHNIAQLDSPAHLWILDHLLYAAQGRLIPAEPGDDWTRMSRERG